WISSALLFRLYSYKTLKHIELIYRSTWRTILIQAILFISIYLFYRHFQFNYSFILGSYFILIALTGLNRLLLTYITEFVFKKVVEQRNVIIIGYNKQAKQLASYFDANKSFYQLKGVFYNKNVK